jgi:predicted phosphodiesterase
MSSSGKRSWIVVCVSDTHQRHAELTERLSRRDRREILLHAGDLSNYGRGTNVCEQIDRWFAELPFERKFLVGGNHENLLDLRFKHVEVLRNEEVLIDQSIRLFGSSWRPTNQSNWKDIPQGIDVLLTHNPPWTNGDHVDLERNLRTRIDQIHPLLSVFGHVHADYGVYRSSEDGTIFANAASLPLARSQPLNDPLIFRLSIDEHDKRTIEQLL